MYNGWTNYETWCFALWIDNDEPHYRFTRNLAKIAPEQLIDTLEELAENSAEDALKEGCFGFITDIVNASISRVNFKEIADSIIEEANE